jgi:uncharacterized protein (UPF0261 family)
MIMAERMATARTDPVKRIHVVGTADTKGEELAFLAARIRAGGGEPLVVDVGTQAPAMTPDIAADEVARRGPAGTAEALASGDRGRAVAAMGAAFAAFAAARGDIAAIVGIGGGGGTSIVTAGMRELPFGIPKIMVSTLASGDVAPYVGVSDIVMMPSITDLAGLNRISRRVLADAAAAIVAMAARTEEDSDGKPAIGLTMFGVTTPCVTAITGELRDDYDCLVFHATGTGGRTMEKLGDSGALAGVLDMTTTEVCDFLFGGVLPATADRLGAIKRTGIPYVGSAGGLDMVNFWAPETIPPKYGARRFHRHNPNVTLMRTTPEESTVIGEWIALKLNECEGPVRFLIPERGVSALDREGSDFFDPEADAALFSAIENTIRQTERRRVERLPLHINDPQFARRAVAAFRDMVGEARQAGAA